MRFSFDFSWGGKEKRKALDTSNLPKWYSLLLGNDTKSGEKISEEGSMQISAVYTCVNKIATTIAALPVNVITTNNGLRQVDASNPVQTVISKKPSEYVTAFDFWSSILAYALLHGRGYAQIIRENGRLAELKLWNSQDVQIKEVDGETVYAHKNKPYLPGDVLVISSLRGQSPIRLHMESLGITKAAETYGAQFFGGGAKPHSILAPEGGSLTPEQQHQAAQAWRDSGSGGTKMLPFGFKYTPITIPPNEAQFIETRQFGARDICRIFNVPLSIAGLSDKPTYGTVEQENTHFVQHCIVPWVKRIEQEIDMKLLALPSDKNKYSKFNVNALLRGDMAARKEFYHTMLGDGVFSINDVRALEDMNPIEGGDKHLVQVNQITLDKIEDYSAKISKEDGEG